MATASVTIITALLFLGAGAWIFLMAYWILGRMGLWKFATYRRLRKRYQNEPFNEVLVDWCLDRMAGQWRYKDIRVVSKYQKNRGEILWTFLALTKLPKNELQSLLERRKNDGKQQSKGQPTSNAGQALPTF